MKMCYLLLWNLDCIEVTRSVFCPNFSKNNKKIPTSATSYRKIKKKIQGAGANVSFTLTDVDHRIFEYAWKGFFLVVGMSSAAVCPGEDRKLLQLWRGAEIHVTMAAYSTPFWAGCVGSRHRRREVNAEISTEQGVRSALAFHRFKGPLQNRFKWWSRLEKVAMEKSGWEGGVAKR